MGKWYEIFPKNTGLSLYVWIIFCVLPFYFIFKPSTMSEIMIGILMILLFFTAYRLSFVSSNWLVYVWIGIEMVISIFMTVYFGYVYFALFLAFFIGSLQHKVGFFTVYGIHLLTTIVAITFGFFVQTELFFSQLPFVIISVIGVILLPINRYNRNKREKLEQLLAHANTKLLIIEERQRIARDLHDTLGQKLSLIGLKSDLAKKLIKTNPHSATLEIDDIHQTA
ncbi:MAG TPA: histidine kinase, partial [Bacillota bacterium]